MPVIVLEAKDLTTPLFLVRTWEVLSSCTTFSLVTLLETSDLKQNLTGPDDKPFKPFLVYSMVTWCAFFILTLLIHILSLLQFHSLLPLSWKNLTVTVATLGALMSFSSALSFILFHPHKFWAPPVSAHFVAANALACLTFLAYASEYFILCRQPPEQRGYMGSMSGLLKVIQLWGCSQMIPIMLSLVRGLAQLPWELWVACVTYGVCFLMCVVTLVVILGDYAGRCPVPFGKCMTAFILIGMLLYVITTVISYAEILRLIRDKDTKKETKFMIAETVVASVSLLAYTVDFALSIKLMRDRGHS